MNYRELMLMVPIVVCVASAGCRPDLEVTLTANSSYTEGEGISTTVDVTVSNSGTADAPGTDVGEEGYMVDLVLSADPTVPVALAVVPDPYVYEEDMLIQGGRISNTETLAKGATKTYSGQGGPLPSGAPSTAFLCAVVDPGGRVHESNEANNVSCVEIEITVKRLEGRGTATVDGVKSPGEWAHAGTLEFEAQISATGLVEPADATLYVMNDQENLYLGIELALAVVAGEFGVWFGFDEDRDGVRWERGDDALSFDNSYPSPEEGLFGDEFATVVEDSREPAFVLDTAAGGTLDGSGAFGVEVRSGSTFFELAHPLDSRDDAHDFSLTVPQEVGALFNLRLVGVVPQTSGWTSLPFVLRVDA